MLRKMIGLILSAVASAVLLIGLTPLVDAQQQPRSAVRRIQAEQQRRNARIKEQAARFRQEHERRRQEWKLWEEKQRKKKPQGAARSRSQHPGARSMPVESGGEPGAELSS